MANYRRNHYVPIWYQKRFLPENLPEKKFYYLDLNPDTLISNGRKYKRKELNHWGPDSCFFERDLYTTKWKGIESTEIEQKFFGKVDSSCINAIEYFSSFQHPSVNTDAFHALLPYMSIQKLRTPKGLNSLANLARVKDKNLLLFKLQELQQIFCAIWTECIWSIVDASDCETKFILSDHPVTVYNQNCFPASAYCQGANDPEIWLTGTHTLFPLSLNKLLILTNLSWVRYPYGNPLKSRPHPDLFRSAMFNFMQMQTNRKLSELEVNKFNYVIKKRAFRYIAAARKEWLYPEDRAQIHRWDTLGKEYLFMPDPRPVIFSEEILIGYKNGQAEAFDAYGRRPWHKQYGDKTQNDREWETFHAFQGEYARIFGPKRRGLSFEFGRLENAEDSPEIHAHHLQQEARNKKYRH